MGDHKKLSGAQFRKRAKEKQAKVDDLLAQTPKLNTYFTVPSKATSGQTDNTNESDSIAPVHAKSDDVENTPSCSTSDLNVSENQDSEKLNVDSDPAKWVINDAMRDILLSSGIKQNDESCECTKRQYSDCFRYLSRSLFTRTLVNGEERPRSWLVFSKSKGAVYCAPCRLFGKTSALAKNNSTAAIIALPRGGPTSKSGPGSNAKFSVGP